MSSGTKSRAVTAAIVWVNESLSVYTVPLDAVQRALHELPAYVADSSVEVECVLYRDKAFVHLFWKSNMGDGCITTTVRLYFLSTGDRDLFIDRTVAFERYNGPAVAAAFRIVRAI